MKENREFIIKNDKKGAESYNNKLDSSGQLGHDKTAHRNIP